MSKNQLQKQSAKLIAQAKAWLAERFGEPEFDIEWYTWHIQTEIGAFRATLGATHDGGIDLLCRFDNVGAARCHYLHGHGDRLNPYSGKWNWDLWGEYKPVSDEKLERFLNTWLDQLDRVEPILINEPIAA